MADHFSNSLRNLEQRTAQSNQQLFKNQSDMNTGLAMAEEHIWMIRRVLNDAVSGVTAVKTINRPSMQPDAAPGDMERAQIIDWSHYIAQLRACQGFQSFLTESTMYDEKLAAFHRTKAIKQAVADIHSDRLETVLKPDDGTEARTRYFYAESLEQEPDTLPWTPQIYATVRQMLIAEQRRRAAEKKVEVESETDEHQDLMDEFSEVAKASGDAVKALESGDEVSAAEAIKRLEAAAAERIADNPTVAQDFPDGAQVFGGDQ